MGDDMKMPGTVWKPGPLSKVGYGGGVRGPKSGDVKHSMEGWASNVMNILEGPRRASWHFSVLLNGEIQQHYEADLWCWHAANVEANKAYIGIEHEGVAGIPITTAQVAATSRITQWAAEKFGRAKDFARYPIQPSDGWTLVEHNQVSDTGTDCPSNRIPWARVLDRLKPQEEDDLDYKLFMTWNPAQFWVVAYPKKPAGFPLWKRWVTTQVGAQMWRDAYGEPTDTTLAELGAVPSL